MTMDRIPYVDDDAARANPAEAARRSAEIDRSEADGYDYDDPRRAERLASAARWDEQAARLSEHDCPCGDRFTTAAGRRAHHEVTHVIRCHICGRPEGHGHTFDCSMGS